MSVSIIALLAVFVAPELANLNKSQSVADAAELIKQKLLEAQGMAFAPPIENNKTDAYGLKFISNGGVINQIQLQAHNSSGAINEVKKAISLDNAKIIMVVPADLEIIWFTIGGQNKLNYTTATDGINAKSLDADAKIAVGNLLNSTSDQRIITINKDSGVINVTEAQN